MEEKGWLALTLPAHGEETWALLPEGRGHLTAASPAGNTAAGGCSLPPGLTPSQGLGGWDLGGCPWNPKAQGTHRLFTGPTVLVGHVLPHLLAAACKQHGTGRGLSFPFRLISFHCDALARCLFNPGCDVCFHWFPFTG